MLNTFQLKLLAMPLCKKALRWMQMKLPCTISCISMRRVEADSAAFVVKDLIVSTPSQSTSFIPSSAKPYAGHGTGRNSFHLRNDGTARGLHEKRWPIALSMETWNIFSRYGSRKRKESQGSAIAKCQCRL